MDNWDGRRNLPAPISGACVVAGFGATLFSDLERLSQVRPDLPTIAVNAAAGHVKAFAVFSMHWEADKLGKWARQQHEAFGEGFEVHACGKPEWREHNLRNYPHVGKDNWHDNVMHRGSSGWAAARLALKLGFDQVILCGVPMDNGRYANGGQAIMFQSPQTNSLSVFRKAIELDSITRTRCFSMSGWTRDLLGEPPWIREADACGPRGSSASCAR